MKFDSTNFKNYETSRLDTYVEFLNRTQRYSYDDLPKHNIDGLPIAIVRDKTTKRLEFGYSSDTHAVVVGATRSGKTTGYIIPTIHGLARKKNKPSLFISDPKGELYSLTSNLLRTEGYRVLVLNFRDYLYSERWNPLLKIYDEYHKGLAFNPQIDSLTKKINEHGAKSPEGMKLVSKRRELLIQKETKYDDAFTLAEELANMIIVTAHTSDPYWEDSAREAFLMIVFGMLEDSALSEKRLKELNRPVITRFNFNFKTVVEILATISKCSEQRREIEWITKRVEGSNCLRLAANVINNAENTRKCILGSLNTKLAPYKETTVRRVTEFNSFEIDDICESKEPVAIYVIYKDEQRTSYKAITMFIGDLYAKLIEKATKLPNKKRDLPFYFILDEFGNLPPIADFDIVVSACGGRNIWFLIVVQSYAQLDRVYGAETGAIIRDNMNMCIFLGTNNSATKRAFSEECGKTIVLDPFSVMKTSNNAGPRKEIVNLIPVSTLSLIPSGECYITRINEYPLATRIERSYLSSEFYNVQQAPISDYCPARYGSDFDLSSSEDEESIDKALNSLDEIYKNVKFEWQ